MLARATKQLTSRQVRLLSDILIDISAPVCRFKIFELMPGQLEEVVAG
jgi:hypothetical protein